MENDAKVCIYMFEYLYRMDIFKQLNVFLIVYYCQILFLKSIVPKCPEDANTIKYSC